VRIKLGERDNWGEKLLGHGDPIIDRSPVFSRENHKHFQRCPTGGRQENWDNLC
jgi:hypothetical protein